ncbi:GNAT family N-acetyltransferase [Kurthia zopfii]|uniref:GNAT family N-acetyltransferase n=1 Tax=Kurthia zopfii TaxID=1650 RepID=UPI000F6FE4AF|nr:GNAT family N-acetyltransferase [Kurthia zopfii]VEI07338.1 ribosomal-protein-alanine acetyltransferase [Kurthia zopfii]
MVYIWAELKKVNEIENPISFTPTFDTEPINEHGLYFFRMSVLPTMQGLGIAKQLLLALEGIARDSGVHTINCKVRVSVLRNLQLYQSKGYAIYNQQVVEADNGTKIDIVTMTKTISN